MRKCGFNSFLYFPYSCLVETREIQDQTHFLFAYVLQTVAQESIWCILRICCACLLHQTALVSCERAASTAAAGGVAEDDVDDDDAATAAEREDGVLQHASTAAPLMLV